MELQRLTGRSTRLLWNTRSWQAWEALWWRSEFPPFFLANVGDSRLYLIEREGIRQITRDHSYVEEMVSLGQITRDSLEYKKQKNYITRAVGIAKTVEADFFEVGLKEGDYILLCSDGLSNMVDNSAMFRLVLLPGPLESKARALIALANQNGGKDNIAVVLVDPQISEVDGL